MTCRLIILSYHLQLWTNQCFALGQPSKDCHRFDAMWKTENLHMHRWMHRYSDDNSNLKEKKDLTPRRKHKSLAIFGQDLLTASLDCHQPGRQNSSAQNVWRWRCTPCLSGDGWRVEVGGEGRGKNRVRKNWRVKIKGPRSLKMVKEHW